ncbi:GrpB family protein [Luteimicrobium album]|uniref:GrpB family protein n=1 Tax=Luteimicrobium album TaxID=1054550 RepID=UPI0024E17879|nr:GrpB family protein [Luteimicrobium album]
MTADAPDPDRPTDLRHDDAARARYEGVKRRLARQEWSDKNAYADAKGPVIEAIMSGAERWAASTGWTVSRA